MILAPIIGLKIYHYNNYLRQVTQIVLTIINKIF